VILPLLETDLCQILHACVKGRLHEVDMQWRDAACATVVLASPGYPGAYPKGLPISGLDAGTDDHVIVFHAGTTQQAGEIVTSGGRVLNVTATGPDLQVALERAYAAVDQIHFENMHFRRDIGGHA
jgi:phosphoribosylamine--glycine ligase